MTQAARKLFSWKSYQRKSVPATIILFAAALLPFLTKFPNGFVWDDHEFIEDNPAIRSLANIPSFFTQPVVNLYRPLRTVFYAAAYGMFGVEPLGYHLTGWGLHLGCVLVLFALLRRLGIPHAAALAGAALFAVHPVHTEAVTFITASFDLLGPLLFLLSLYFFWGDKSRPAASLICFALALLSSEMTATLPLLLGALLLHRGVPPFAALRRLTPHFILLLGYLALRFGVLGIGARDAQHLGGSFAMLLLTLPSIAFACARLLLFPFPLLADYRHFPVVAEAANPAFWGPLLILAAATAAVMWKRRRHPLLFLGWIWIWIALLPVSNLIPIGNPMAERYLYLPSAGLSFAAAGLMLRPSAVKKGAAAAILACLALGSAARNAVWKNDATLWTQTALDAPQSYVARNNLGSFYLQKGLYNSAYEEIMAALRLKPDFADAHTNLGALFEKRGMWREARQSYENAAAIHPLHAPSRCNLGNMLLKEGKVKEAMESYRKAAEINPNFYIAYYNMGNIEYAATRLDEAEKLYRKALEIHPAFEDARHNLEVTLYQRRLRQSTTSGEAMKTLE